jgi:hypothetical protein
VETLRKDLYSSSYPKLQLQKEELEEGMIHKRNECYKGTTDLGFYADMKFQQPGR